MFTRFFVLLSLLSTCFTTTAFAVEYRCEASCVVHRIDALSCSGGNCNETCYSCQRMGLQCTALGGGYVGCRFENTSTRAMSSSDINLTVAQRKMQDQCREQTYRETGYWGAPDVRGMTCKAY